MKTYKTFGIVAAVWAALACVMPQSVCAAPPGGDIWSISRANGGDHGPEETLSMANNPVTAGQKVKFKFRMLNRDPKANFEDTTISHGEYASATTWDNRWYWKYRGAGGTNEAAAAWVSNPPRVGVWVSGRRQWADVESLAPVDNNGEANYDFTDLICSYTAQPGDFGILKFAAGSENNSVEATADTYPILLQNSDYWGIYDKLTQSKACSFWLTSQTDSDIYNYVKWPPPYDVTPTGQGWVQDPDLSQAGIYIRTIDFDSSAFNTSGIWRRIAAKGTSSYINDGKVKRSPTLSIPGGVATDHTVTLYAWTEDESVAYMNDGVAETFVTNGVSFTRKVVRINIAPEDGEAKEIPGGIFALEDATNKTTTIYLSATPTNIYRAGVLITNFVTRTILVGPPEPPSLVLLADGEADHTAMASADYLADYHNGIVPISVTLEGVGDAGYASDLNVTVTAEMINSSADPLDFVGLSETQSSDLNSYGASVTVTIPSGYSSALLYAFVKRAKKDDTTAADKGIRLKATVDAAAEAFFSGGIIPATLHIKPSPPVVISPAEGASFVHVPGGNNYTFKIAVGDAFGEMTSGSKYTVYWSNQGNGIYTPYSNLTLDAGELTVTVKYLTGGNYNSQFYVANQDAAANDSPGSDFTSAVRTISVQVDEPRVITLTADRTRYNEGEPATITMTLSEDFSAAAEGFLFLVPQDEDSSNLVECVQYPNFAKGVSILAGSRTADLEVNFLDGKPSTLRYAAVLRNNENINEGDEIGGFASKVLLLSVSNVVPRVTKVAMGHTPFGTNGGLHPTKIAQGVLTDFQVQSVDEPSDMDRTNGEFLVEWSFYNQAGSQLWTTNMLGDPYADASMVQYAFPESGTNSVTVRAKDKDTTTGQWKNAELFTFKVETLGTPMISLTPYRGSKTFLETDTGSENGRIDVHLNMAPTESITVMVSVTNAVSSDTTMPPTLNTYYVTIPPGSKEGSFFIKEMDGTDNSALNGFIFTAAVTNETVAPNSGGKKWKDYYTFDPAGLTIYVLNKAPEIAGANDNTVTNIATLNVPYTIKWTVTDVMPDMTNDLQVSWMVEGEGTFDSTLTDVTSRSFTTNFTFTFTKPQGNTTRRVVLTVMDKDGGSASREWFFRVDPQKPVSLFPLGPDTKGQTILSRKYARQPGRGAGRVWADGALSKIENFMQTWNYPPNTTLAYVFGYGYRAGEVDDGNLQPVSESLPVGTKLGINKIGNQATAAPWYPADTAKDSFFYCWVGSGEGEDSGSSSSEGVHLGPIAPVLGTNVLASSARQKVTLAAEAKDEENPSYAPVAVEAVFSKEWRVKDNVGDINADGIPDVFAVDYDWKGGLLFESVGGALEDGGDLLDLSAPERSNLDSVSTVIGQTASGDTGDFLPSMTSAGSGTLIPSIQSDWALYGRPFTTKLELRGFGDGLNFRADASDQGPYTAGEWIGDRDFTEVELAAWSNAWVAAGSPGTLETFDWTPENRTDPTVDDTDGDGLPDGYEYYFWYHAYVGNPVTGKRLAGERFRLTDIAVGTPITSDEIARAFNPNVKNDEVQINERDTDNDGLSDLEEFAIGTNPVHWDTDGDGVSDYWEVLRGLNPLVVESDETDPDTNPDKDYMAWAEVGKDYALLTLPDGRMFALPNNGAPLIVQDGSSYVINTNGTNVAMTVAAIPVYRYGDASSTLVPTNRGVWTFKTKTSLNGSSQKVFQEYTCTFKPLDASPIDWGADVSLTNVIDVLTNLPPPKVGQTLTLVHEQVRAQYGFDPRTGWYSTKEGYVRDRWNPGKNSPHAQRIGDAGLAVNTKAYSNLDEYLLLKYRYMTAGGSDQSRSLTNDVVALDAEETTLGKIFTLGTTNPNKPYADMTYGNFAAIFGNVAHGADTDGDGVPDGWELYVGFDPNVAKTVTLDNDGDSLALNLEFAGTDSCNAYEATVTSDGNATIYSNHPGLRLKADGTQNGWFNKFFPTDPWNGDTDGDNIRDDTEGGSWKMACVLNHAMRVAAEGVGPYTFTFVYGDSADDGSLCIRGGGMNPCSVDTDFDLLPDPWEMCHAGVRAEGGVLLGAPFVESVTTLCKRNDGLSSTNVTANGMYITGGMDATFGLREDSASFTGDAFTNPRFVDPRTGTVRNFDFDQDGLQNFQEYLTQALRHLRYDDSETPLMGSWMPDGTPSSRKFLGFLPMNIMDGETFYTMAKNKGFVASGAWQFRELGYFARPPHEWDPTALIPRGNSDYDETGYRVMLPPHGLGANGQRLDPYGYASTDPRMWDTDEDNMGDYYEIFHGLNPLLGSVLDAMTTAGDAIAQAYGGNILFWHNAWTGWPMMPQDWLSGDAAYRDIDAIKYPWMIGTPEADADGDGIRNLEEALVVNMTSPQPTHTDPTPLWLTDSTARNSASYTSQYYMRDKELNAYPWGWDVNTVQTGDGAATDFLFSFEENEGYDTDGDWIADNDERQQTATPISDPLNFTDVDHRQPIWFPGMNSAAVSYSANYHRLNYAAYDLLRQFTVEAWIRPEDVSRDQVILERVAVYGASTLSNNLAKVRANFRIGIRAEDGRLYGLFDTNDAIDSGTPGGTAEVLGLRLTANRWTHVALTFNGAVLALYMDGEMIASASTELTPANGLVNFVEEAVPNMGNFPVLNNGYTAVPCAMVLGARAMDVNGVSLSKDSAWSSYGSFYAGYLDEVRVWDGARALNDIKTDMKNRYSFAAVQELREKVYGEWKNGATRNDNDDRLSLPAELVALYSFQTLPGATDSQYVAWEPSGFTKNVRSLGKVEGNNVPGDIYCGWWYATPVRSTVYKNYRLVPWIQNMVGHLPLMDGSTFDSQYWSEWYGGMTVPDELNGGISQIIFPNTANPYPYYIFTTERRHHQFKLEQMCDKLGILPKDVKWRYEFELRTAIVGSSDLVPLGGAFAKRCDAMWDDNGAADAWAMTFRDNNANGIPDWWEAVAIAQYGAQAGFTWDDPVTWGGREMKAREAYLRDLAGGMMPPNGAIDGTFASKADADNDGLPDWWENLYGIATQNGRSDTDNDQLSNAAEYLISEWFTGYDYRFMRVDPLKPKSFADDAGYLQAVPDYFLRVGYLYLGEMFGDHDFMEDAWEDKFDSDMVSRFTFDAWTDSDSDGWSNWAECRADTDPTKQNRAGIDNNVLNEHPIPEIKATIVYNGAATLDAPIYVQAYSKNRLGNIPDAVWEIGTGRASEKYIGINPRKAYNLILGPGVVEPGSVTLNFADIGRIGSASSIAWYWAGNDKPIPENPTKGNILLRRSVSDEWDSAGVIGTIDYETGVTTIDFEKVIGTLIISTEDANGNGGQRNVTMSLETSFVKLSWQSVTPRGNNTATLHLKDPEKATAGKSLGSLREGKNLFTAFLDTDGDGSWTPGEPFGAAADVDVGWSATSFTVELTKTAPQITRMNLAAAAVRAGYTTGGSDSQSSGSSSGQGSSSGAEVSSDADTRVRIVRYLFNGEGSTVDGTVVYDAKIDLTHHPFLTEADLMAAGMYDLDWEGLVSAWVAQGGLVSMLTNATYRVIFGDAPVNEVPTDANAFVLFNNVYEYGNEQTPAVPVEPDGGVFDTRPTFKWTHAAPEKDYPAFRLRVWKDDGSLVYDSGVQHAPARTADGTYSWTAPIYADMMTPQGVVFATMNNYLWSVSMLDAKFTEPSASEVRKPFRLQASGELGTISDYGAIKVCVRYYGPAAVSDAALAGMVHVQAFTSPDFTGVPAGEAYVKNVANIASISDLTPNATILGVKPGTYYVRAFVDSNSDCAWSNWETCGYYNFVGAWDASLLSVKRGSSSVVSAADYVYTPRPVTVAEGAAIPEVTVYMEDMDTDKDYLPDAWEWVTGGSLTARGAPAGSTFFTRVNPDLLAALPSRDVTTTGPAHVSPSLMSSLLSSPDFATVQAMQILLSEDGQPAEQTTVRIESFSLDDGLSLSIATEVPQADATRETVFVVTDSADVDVVLVAAKKPDFVDARETTVKTITIKANAETKEVVSAADLKAAIDAAGFNDAAFFKVRLEEAK